MPQLFTFSASKFSLASWPSKMCQFSSQNQLYQLAQQCRRCSQSIIYNQCITICSCNRYAHEKCLIQQLEQNNTQKQELEPICSICKRKIVVYSTIQFKLKKNITLKNIFGILISILLAAAMIVQIEQIAPEVQKIQFSRLDLKLFLATLILSLAIVSCIIFIINMVIVREHQIIRIKPTNLELVISAFIGIGTQEKEDQGTGIQLIK